MKLTDAATLVPILTGGPLERGRKCQRRSLARRLKRGNVRDLTQRDLHYIRQARFIARLGRTHYDLMHTKDLTCREIR